MNFANSTHWTDPFLRRMLAWCCRHVGFKARRMTGVQFRKRSSGCYSGHAYGSRRIVVSIGPEDNFPAKPDSRPGMQNEVIGDQVEALVAVTAHEIAHLCQYRDGRSSRLDRERKSEHDARWHEVRALRDFRADREALLARWSAMPLVIESPEESDPLPVAAVALPKAKPPIVERRAAKAEADLARWLRKLKLAQTKVRGYKRRVAYYSKKQAAKRAP